MTKPKPIFLIAVLLIGAIGLFLRFSHLAQQGILCYDEGWYMLVAQSYSLFPQFLMRVAMGEEAKAAFQQIYPWGFVAHLSYKPSYQVFLILTKTVAGLTNPAAAAYLSAIFSSICVAIIGYTVYRQTGSPWWSLAGILLGGTSGFMVRYARFGGPYTAGAMILMVYVAVYQWRLKANSLSLRQQFLLGVLLGSFVTFYDTLLPIALVLTAVEVGVLFLKERPALFKKAGIFLLGCLTPTLFWELFIDALRKIFHWTLHKGYVEPYIKQVLSHVTNNPVKSEYYAEAQIDYLYFFKVFSMTDGKLMIALILLSFPILGIYLLKNKFKDQGLLFITGLSLLCFGLISVYPDKVSRMAAPFFPLFILSTVLGLWALNQLLFKSGKSGVFLKAAASTLLVVIMALPGALYSYKLTQVTTGYSAAADKIRELLKPGESMATPLLWPIYTNYLQQKVHRFVDFERFLKAMQPENNVRYLVFDMQNLTHITRYCQPDSLQCPYPKEFRQVDAIENYLVAHHAKQWRFYNPVTRDFQFYLEEHQPIEYSHYLLAHSSDTQYGYIRIYEVPANLDLNAIQQTLKF